MLEPTIIEYIIAGLLLTLLVFKTLNAWSKNKGKTQKQMKQAFEDEWGFKRIGPSRLLYSVLFSLGLILCLYLLFGYQKATEIQLITIALALSAPLWEELAFRRLLFDDLILNTAYKMHNINWKKSAFWLSLALSIQALIFVLAHSDTALGFSYYGRFLMAAIAGLVYIRYDRNIFYPMAVHFAYNLGIILMNLV